MNKEKSIEALNTLIEINNNRIEIYGTSSKHSSGDDVKDLFFKLMQSGKKCRTELISEVLQLGGIPIEGIKTNGKLFGLLIDIRTALRKNLRKAILSSCVFSERIVIDTYEAILKNNLDHIHSDQLVLLNAQRQLIITDHDDAKKLDTNCEFLSNS